MTQFSDFHTGWSILLFSFFVSLFFTLNSQNNTWQQRAKYIMNIDVDVKKFRYKGQQKITYWNHSPDTLSKVYFHLYWNAFQPGSAMDQRLQEIRDPDKRMVYFSDINGQPISRISNLKSNEIGYQKIISLTQNGQQLSRSVDGTILEVTLNQSILPSSHTIFEMEWETQIPVIIRRAGRQNKEGIELSMSQWYPKFAEYDAFGWHIDEYIAREFHGVFSDFDVTITLDKKYIVGASGVLQNPQEVNGYGGKAKKKKATYHFNAENIHDFAWAADPDYTVKRFAVLNDGPKIYFIYQKNDKTYPLWEQAKEPTKQFFQKMSEYFGKYPYPIYTIIQGGDGGMEYGEITLINGEHETLEKLSSLIFHEAAHSWFQHILATDETRYAWMDEGFTTYAENLIFDEVFKKNRPNPWRESYLKYYNIVEQGVEEPMSVLSDHFMTNKAYKVSSYSKGVIFLCQLEYIVGRKVFRKLMKRYFNEWKFRHPTPIDFIRIAEKELGMDLKWYLNYWTKTTHYIDYKIDDVKEKNNEILITLKRSGVIPMPIDFYVEYTDGSKEMIYIPLQMMRGEKTQEFNSMDWRILDDWTWTSSTYQFSLPKPLSEVKLMFIDPTQRLADINYQNNIKRIQN